MIVEVPALQFYSCDTILQQNFEMYRHLFTVQVIKNFHFRLNLHF